MSKSYVRAAVLALPLALSLGSAHAATNLLQNGSFEASSPASSQDGGYCYTNYAGSVACNSAVPSWSGNFELISAGSGPWNNPQGLGNSAAIDGAVIAGIQNDSSLSQTVSLAAGTYTLTWVDTNRNGYDNQTYDVKLNGSVLDTLRTQAGSAWIAHTLTFTVASAGLQTLSFAGQSLGGDRTSFIDNVQLVAAVPEPEAFAMMAAGLLVVGAVARRRAAR